MKVVLLNPPLGLLDVSRVSPPLGLLVLGRVATDLGWEVEIVDIDLEMRRSSSREPATSWGYPQIVERIIAASPDVLAITSMGLNTHVGIEVARQVKSTRPEVSIIVGGPHFGAIRDYVEQNTPFIDALASGPGEFHFAEHLRSLMRGGAPVASTTSSVLRHPIQSYELLPLEDYFQVNGNRVICAEFGRGCIFKCKYCYSPLHYPRVEHAQIDDVLLDLQAIANLGAKHVFMVQDNFLNDTKWADALLQAMRGVRLGITWNCYATLPQLTKSRLVAMTASGCTDIYVGIDAVSKRQRSSFGKSFYDRERFAQTLAAAVDVGAALTCAFICDLDKLDLQEIDQTFEVALTCSLAGMSIRLAALALYPGTQMYVNSHARYSSARPEILLDCPEIVIDNGYARAMPAAFPFHATSIAEHEWRRRVRFLFVSAVLLQSAPMTVRSMAKARMTSVAGLLLDLSDSWSDWELLEKSERKRSVLERFGC